MRVAVLSDVHGNRFALDAVLEDVRACSPDVVANLGDQVFGSADPEGAWARQQELGAVEVRGNTDEMVVADLNELEGSRPQVEWLRGRLPAAALHHLRSLPTTATLADGEVVLAHGNLTSPWTPMLFSSDENGTSARHATPEELTARATGFDQAKVFVVGHTHQELLRATGSLTFVNAGAVSRQMHGDPHARWVLLERRGSVWNVSFRRVEYDVESAARWTETHHFDPGTEARQLRTGRLT